MKVSTSSTKELTSKLKKTYEKTAELRAKNSELKKEVRRLNKRVKVITRSRDEWKAKNKKKANKNKGLGRRLARRDKPKRHHYGIALIELCVLLRVMGGCTYRGICRILKILQLCCLLEIPRIPCANTFENWVSKMGLYRLENGWQNLDSKEVCLIIDENLKVSNEKVLLILVSCSQKAKTGPLKHQDVEVFFLAGQKTWTGLKIEQQVEELKQNTGLQITHVLSDEDSKLRKATRLLGVPHLPDISHAVANCLRKTFKGDQTYQAMIKLIGGYSAKCVNQDLTYLRPPKQRVKARFMNQKPLIYWALTLVSKFGKLNEKEQLFFKELKSYMSLLHTLKQCIELSEQIIKPLKNKGLCLKTLQNFKRKIKQNKKKYSKNKLIMDFIGFLEKYANQYEDFLQHTKGSYNVSSDVIEGLFGKHKELMGSNPLMGMSLLDLELPVHCIAKDEIRALIKPALEATFMTSLFEWRTTHSFSNQALMRKKFFGK